MSLSLRPLARPLLAGLLLAAATVGSTFAQTAPPVVVEGSPGFDPYQYIGRGDVFNCANFGSQAEAQAVLRADPTDPNKLDTDRPAPDGIACEHNPRPFDLVRVPRG